MIFIGIDLAWTYKKESGICIMDEGGCVLLSDAKVYSDEELVNIVLNYIDEEVCVGIDASIIVKNEQGSRPAEGLMMRDRIHGHCLQAFNSNRSYFNKAFGGIRGERIFDGIKKSDVNSKVTDVFGSECIRVMEVFPTGVCLGLFPDLYPLKYKIKGKRAFVDSKSDMGRLIARITMLDDVVKNDVFNQFVSQDIESMTQKVYKHFEDQVDAFLCAYGMYEVWKGSADQRLYGDAVDGFMMVPIVKEDKR